jgi:hypothetical protein
MKARKDEDTKVRINAVMANPCAIIANHNAVIARSAATKQSVTIRSKVNGQGLMVNGRKKPTNVVIANPNAFMVRSRQLKANKIHFQLSTFNFQLISDCFAALAMTARGDAMTARGGRNDGEEKPRKTIF